MGFKLGEFVGRVDVGYEVGVFEGSSVVQAIGFKVGGWVVDPKAGHKVGQGVGSELGIVDVGCEVGVLNGPTVGVEDGSSVGESIGIMFGNEEGF